MEQPGLRVFSPIALAFVFVLAACGAPQTTGPSQSAVPRTPMPAAVAGLAAHEMWNATVVVENGPGHGTGVIIGRDRVLTAYHVVDEGVLEIEFFGGERVAAEVYWADPNLDLAMVAVPVPSRYRASQLFCGELDRSQKLTAIGHPLTTRWVSVEGSLGAPRKIDLDRLLPLSFDLSLGNSGGPVFDEAGRVVGIASAILVRQGVENIAATTSLDPGRGQTGTGLMLPAHEFCTDLVRIPL